MARPDSRAGRGARQLAARALSVDQTSDTEAERNFRRALTRPQQLRLAHEAATTRSAELKLAYPGLVSVGSGFRTRRAYMGGKPELTREPCVIFVVAKKWKTKCRPGDPRHLPAFLLAVAGPDEQRMLCAIPTDVRPLSQYGRPRPRAGGNLVPMPFGILVQRAGDPALVRGVAACGVQRPAQPGTVLAMSCRHVLSRSLRDANGNQTGLGVLLNRPTLPSVGTTLAARGDLVAGPAFSFDAQLMEMGDSTGLKRAMAGLKFTASNAYLHDPGDVGLGFWIATGRAQASGRRTFVWVDYTGTVVDFEMPYRLGNGTVARVCHELVLHGISESLLMEGDSGSPAVRNQDGRELMGMYLGGQGNEAYVLPAWQLMNPRNQGVSNELRWGVAPIA